MLDDAPFLLRLFGWSLDDSYDHTITWRFSLRRLAPPRSQSLAEQRFAAAAQTIEVEV
jgi:hypothetical protein